MTEGLPLETRPVLPEPMLELRGVDAAYGHRLVVRDVSLRVAPAERIALVGPNGAGKSSLLRVLTGVLPARRGEILVGGIRVEGLSRDAIARRVAVVPEVAVLPFGARVEEVVGLGRLPHEDPLRGPRAADRAAVAAAIDRVGIGRLLGRDARELSLGERQLVLVGVAVAQAAPLIVLDEPTVHLDLRHQVEVMELLVDINRRDGTTIIAVLHDLNLAARYFDRVIVLADGQVVADGPPGVALTAERIRDVFGVDPSLVGAAVPSGEWAAGT